MACTLAAAIVVVAFAYSPRVQENDASPWVGACGRVFAGSVAVSQDLFHRPGFNCGDVITVGGKRYVVNDTMNIRHERSVDVWYESTATAVKQGRRTSLACSPKAWPSPSLGYWSPWSGPWSYVPLAHRADARAEECDRLYRKALEHAEKMTPPTWKYTEMQRNQYLYVIALSSLHQACVRK